MVQERQEDKRILKSCMCFLELKQKFLFQLVPISSKYRQGKKANILSQPIPFFPKKKVQFTFQITNKQQQTKTPTINPKGKNVWRDKCHINNDFLMSRFTNPIWFPKSPQTSHCSRGPAQGSGKKCDTVNRGRRQAASTKGPLRQGEGRTRAQGHPWSLKGPHTPRGGFFFPNRP